MPATQSHGHGHRQVQRALVAALLLSGTGIVGAQVSGSTAKVGADAGLYLDYLSMGVGGLVCSERIPGFTEKFEPLFAKWQQKRFVQLSRGPSALRQVQEEHGINYEELLPKVAQKLREAETKVVVKECYTLLEVVEPYPTQ